MVMRHRHRWSAVVSSSGDPARLAAATPYAGAIVLACGGAFIAARTPAAASIGLTALLCCLLVLICARRRLDAASVVRMALTRRSSISADVIDAPAARVDVDTFRFGRYAFYGGLVLIGQLTFRPIISVATVSDLLFFGSLCFAAASLAARRARVAIELPRLLLAGVLVFMVGSLVSSFATETPQQSVTVLLRVLYLTLIWFWLATIVLRRDEHVRTAIVVWVVSAAVDGAGALIQSLAGNVIPGGEVHWGRVTGFTQNINDLGGVTSIALVPAVMLLIELTRRKLHMSISGVLVALIVIGLLVSGSVGSVLAATVALGLWLGSHRTRFHRRVAVCAIAAGATALYTVHHSGSSLSAIQRIERFGSGSPNDPNRTLDSRLAGYRVAIKRIDQDPFVGIGLDTYTVRDGQQPVHNIALGVWYQAGLIGLIGIVLVLVAAVRASWATIVDAQTPIERALAPALAGSLTALIVFLMSEPQLFIRYGWVSAALIFALRAIQVRRIRDPITA